MIQCLNTCFTTRGTERSKKLDWLLEPGSTALAIPSPEWAARGLAIGDINNDGKLDAVVTTNDGPAWVLLNKTPTANHWIILNLVGVKSNRDAIGAQVKVSTVVGDRFATVTTSSSYQSS